jgi:O-succinylbenzoic acid--CoA ligase
VIVTGGEKVAPDAVERVLAAQPEVRAACVVGLPDDEWGAVVAAAVVVDPGADPERLRAAVREALGRAAVPRVLRVVDALPLRGIGKPDRNAVVHLLTAVSRSRPAG